MLGCEVFARTDVYFVLQLRDLRAYETCTRKKKIRPGGQQSIATAPFTGGCGKRLADHVRNVSAVLSTPPLKG